MSQYPHIYRKSLFSAGHMNSNVFYPNLNEFCRKYLVSGEKLKKEEIAAFDPTRKRIEAEVFENLLLFDKVTFKVFGENIPLAVLINLFGLKRFEELVEQNAIGFTLWTPGVVFLETNIAGVDTIASMVHNSKPHSDPEESLELGLNWMHQKPKRSERRALVRKLRDVYQLPDKSIPADSVAFTKSAYLGGKFAQYGLDSSDKTFDALGQAEKKVLVDCATDLLEYSYILSNQMTSFSKSQYFDFFTASQKRMALAEERTAAFCKVGKLENFPDMKALYEVISTPYEKLIKARRKRVSVKFRNWLGEKVENSDGLKDITTEYIDAIAEPQGFFQTWPGKLTKSVVTSSVGAGVGMLIAGPLGMMVGAATAKAVDPVLAPVLDLVDGFLLDGLTKGWTPRLFFDELRKF